MADEACAFFSFSGMQVRLAFGAKLAPESDPIDQLKQFFGQEQQRVPTRKEGIRDDSKD